MNIEPFQQKLVEEGLVAPSDLEKCQRTVSELGKSLDKVLTEEGILEEIDLLCFFSKQINTPVLRLSSVQPDPSILKLIPQKILKNYEVFPISRLGNIMTIAMSDPTNIVAVDDIKEITSCVIMPVLASGDEIQKNIESVFSEQEGLDELLSDLDSDEDLEFVAGETVGGEDEIADSAPVIKMVNLILQDSLKKRASDIHIEMFEEKLRVRLRIDGELNDAFNPPRGMHGPIIARLKIMADLDITERRVPQDGRFKIRLKKKEVDFRLSILPCVFGEKAVMRILDKSALQVGLEKLGYLEENLNMFKEAIQSPYGMILVTGPTGSGKSTTLYSILNMMNTPERNIMTVEDPVEYQVHGITQTQVHHEIGLTFAAGLRTLLRQSPDVILVGEIRDGETADIAVKAALTGHLVFSTLHTNSACGAVTRLMDMGVEPFLIASSLVMVAAQRLCRKICENCKEEVEIPGDIIERLSLAPDIFDGATAYHGKGCEICNGTGYYGRLGTIECYVVNDSTRQLILRGASSEEIEKVAREGGMTLLYENLIKKFKMGLTTLEEVLRLASVT